MPEDYISKPLYRMVHIDNIEYVLRNGLCTRNHKLADPDYINIGDKELITQRNVYNVRAVPPGGTLGEYIPFYFGGHSPMLLNIKTGYRGITLRPQHEIVFLVTSIKRIMRNCHSWCFTNGHAKNNITRFYNNYEDLNNVDWDTVRLRRWANSLEDMDRQRRKEAEFLVKDYVPTVCIYKIYVFNEECKLRVENIVNNIGLDIPVIIDSNKNLYFP